MTPIHILSPFLKAGIIYKWTGNPIGIGIEMSQYRGEGDIEVRIGESKQILLLNKAEARDFIRYHRSVYMAHATRLGVVPKYMFKEKEVISNQKVLI